MMLRADLALFVGGVWRPLCKRLHIWAVEIDQQLSLPSRHPLGYQ